MIHLELTCSNQVSGATTRHGKRVQFCPISVKICRCSYRDTCILQAIEAKFPGLPFAVLRPMGIIWLSTIFYRRDRPQEMPVSGTRHFGNNKY